MEYRVRLIRLISVICLLLCICCGIWGVHSGILTSQEKMEAFIEGAGVLGPLLFIIFQIVQVVLPVLPGGISCLAGVVMFGSIKGFIYNYTGICIGSFIVFGIAKNLGRPFVMSLFGAKAIMKYDRWTRKKGNFDKIFAFAIFFPVAPDDLLCYLAGTTAMSWKKFIFIILMGKPAAIFLYSSFLNTIWMGILTLIR